jgi:4-diphosphocytidyl-2-C-methyl-D-erythritol kinase
MTTVRALAKITLSLRILGTRPDGFHELEALTVTATEPYDELQLVEAPASDVRVTGPFAEGVPAGPDNLVLRALAQRGRTMSVRLDKGIPHGAGLGGGSSDAAAVLRATGGSSADAAALGSDVPFCLDGGPAWMRGRGEIVERIAGLAQLDLVIAAPAFGCATPAVYRAWDALGGPSSERTVPAPPGYPGPFVNDLEPAAEHVEPRLREFRLTFEEAIGRAALLCGSGSAYAAWFDRPAAAVRAASAASAAFGRERLWVARTFA